MAVLPDSYRGLSAGELRDRIREKKAALGNRLLILGHHYQRQEVIELADCRGDSLGLSRTAAGRTECEFIVFCGVRFMAESAEILRQDHQKVQHPDPLAGCPMADMAGIEEVEAAWSVVVEAAGEDRVVPVTYMNSSAELKAFCGRHGGVVCTSSNAPLAFRWALRRGERVLFFPDEHLGRNTAREVGIPEPEIALWDPVRSGRDGVVRDELRHARLILWKGFCNVHTRFSPGDIAKARALFPGAKVVVHPECRQEVVQAADAAGSTDFICRYAAEAPAGSTLFIGTEINLVSRLAHEQPDKRIYELSRSLCPNMFRIDLAKLLWTLDGLGRVNLVQVHPEVKAQARMALERMLELSPAA